MTEKDRAIQIVNDYKSTFGTAQGKRVLQHLSDQFLRVLPTEDPILTGFNIGRHRVITYIQDTMARRESDIEMLYKEDNDDGE